MIVIKPPKKLIFNKFSVFLAGSIEENKAENWQEKVERLFSDTDIVIFNPRRDDWDSTWKQEIGDDNFREQVEWELTALEKANNILIYFSPGTMSPISLLELGLFGRTGKMIVVCPDGYKRKGNVDIVCKRYNIKQVDTLKEAVKMIKENYEMKKSEIKEIIRKIVAEVLREDLSDTEPATPKQLWALYAATKKDYRNAGLSKKAAYDLLQKINAEKGYTDRPATDYKKELFNYLQKHSDQIAKKIRGELDIKSVLGHDPEFYGKDYTEKQPKYAFFGSGMGSAWLEYDKRSPIANKIYQASKDIDRPFKDWFLKKYFTSRERDAYQKIGWPLETMMLQSMAINAEIQSLVADFMEEKGVKNVRLRTQLD